MRFDGKVALVTGGGRGIGAATSELFAREGASVAVCDMDLEPAQEVAGPLGDKAVAVTCDVTQRDQVEAAVQKAVDSFGRLDILVTCAGITRDNLVHKMSDDDWMGVINTHLTGTFLAAQAAQRVMVPQRYGRMVFLSSTSALGNRGQTNYSTAKAGLQGMARTLGIELGPFGITVNCIAPGFIRSNPTTERQWEGYGEEGQRALVQGIAMRRLGDPADIANGVQFFVAERSSWVTGQIIAIDGGSALL